MTGNINDPPTTLFVGDLSIFCTENDLFALFSRFGAVPKVQVKRGKQGEALQYGFVVLPRSVAIEAAQRVNGIKLLGRRLRIKLKLSHDSPSIINNDRNRSNWAQIHFSFITHQVTHAIGEEVIDRVFSSIGAVADVAIKQHSISLDPPRQTAYGFIFFYEQEAAQRAIQEMKHVQIDGVMFDCNWSNQRDAEADARRKALARQQPPATAVAIAPPRGGMMPSADVRRMSPSPMMMSPFDLAMAMEGLSMGPAGLTLSSGSNMYGPPLPPPPSPVRFDMMAPPPHMQQFGMPVGLPPTPNGSFARTFSNLSSTSSTDSSFKSMNSSSLMTPSWDLHSNSGYMSAGSSLVGPALQQRGMYMLYPSRPPSAQHSMPMMPPACVPVLPPVGAVHGGSCSDGIAALPHMALPPSHAGY